MRESYLKINNLHIYLNKRDGLYDAGRSFWKNSKIKKRDE